MKRQENRAVIAWREAASAALVSSVDKAANPSKFLAALFLMLGRFFSQN
ncbi:hypothetical protein [Extibacter muris]|nr:hypothetical protein [Extibacter muris]MCU0080630.1 hypothetical protein [Extibacter muris]